MKKLSENNLGAIFSFNQPTELKKITSDIYFRTALLGFVAGLRSLLPLTLISRSNKDASNPLHSETAQLVTSLAAVGEAVGDKLPIVPSRVSKAALAFRLVSGGLAGMTLCQRAGKPPVVGAVLGAAGAGLGSYAGYYGRKALTKITKVPDFMLGAGEDALALRLGMYAVNGDEEE